MFTVFIREIPTGQGIKWILIVKFSVSCTENGLCWRKLRASHFLFLQELLEVQVAGEVDALRSSLVLLERSTIDTLRNENEVTHTHTHTHTHIMCIYAVFGFTGISCTDQETS